MTDTPQGAWMREYERKADAYGHAVFRANDCCGEDDCSFRAAEDAARAALDAHVRGLVDLLDACCNELGETSAEKVGPRIETLAHHPPLTEPQRLRMEAERIERRDALIVRVRAALDAP